MLKFTSLGGDMHSREHLLVHLLFHGPPVRLSIAIPNLPIKANRKAQSATATRPGTKAIDQSII